MMSAGECLKNIRLDLCMTQRAFAKELNISHSTISHYELGLRKPCLSLVKKIVDQLKERGINIEYRDLMNE